MKTILVDKRSSIFQRLSTCVYEHAAAFPRVATDAYVAHVVQLIRHDFKLFLKHTRELLLTKCFLGKTCRGGDCRACRLACTLLKRSGEDAFSYFRLEC